MFFFQENNEQSKEEGEKRNTVRATETVAKMKPDKPVPCLDSIGTTPTKGNIKNRTKHGVESKRLSRT